MQFFLQVSLILSGFCIVVIATILPCLICFWTIFGIGEGFPSKSQYLELSQRVQVPILERQFWQITWLPSMIPRPTINFPQISQISGEDSNFVQKSAAGSMLRPVSPQRVPSCARKAQEPQYLIQFFNCMIYLFWNL